jgi:hypothetical protein
MKQKKKMGSTLALRCLFILIVWDGKICELLLARATGRSWVQALSRIYGSLTREFKEGLKGGVCVIPPCNPTLELALTPVRGLFWIRAPAAIPARLGNLYFIKSLMMWTLLSASVLDKPP